MIVPMITLMIAIMEVLYELENGALMHIIANITMGFVSVSFCGFYLMSEKEKVDYCLIELYLFFYVIFLALDNHLHFSGIVWIIFLPCAIFSMIFIIFLNRKTR